MFWRPVVGGSWDSPNAWAVRPIVRIRGSKDQLGTSTPTSDAFSHALLLHPVVVTNDIIVSRDVASNR